MSPTRLPAAEPADEPTTPAGFTSAEVEALRALTERVVAARAAKAAADAAELTALAEAMALATSQGVAGNDLAVREVAAELAAAVRASDRTIQARMDDAVNATTLFARAVDALGRGEIEKAHLNAIVDSGARIRDDDARAAYEAATLEHARRESPGRSRAAARLLAQRFDPLPLQERHDAAAAGRRIWVDDGDDGMSDLVLRCATALAHGAFDRATRLARAVIEARENLDTEHAEGAAGSGDEPTRDVRTLAQVRADVLAELILSGHATPADSAASSPADEAIHAQVHVIVPAATLAGGHEAAALATGGPIDPDSARRLAGCASTWTRLLTDSAGQVLATEAYRPSAAIRAALTARDRHCRFPGCRQPARRCDIDHTVAREHGGPTRIDNLAHLCRRHHVLKHHSAWRVVQRAGGVLEWTSPTGRVYPDVPLPAVMFTAAPTPPPAPPSPPPGPPPF